MSLTSQQKTDTNTVELQIAVGAEEFKVAVDKAFKIKSKTITVPGFRKGKAPRNMIEKIYGEAVFYDDAINELYPPAYQAALAEAGIEPVDRADVEIVSLSKEEGFVFKAIVTTKPEVEVGNYKGIAANRTTPKVSDADVESELAKLQERNSRVITVEGRAAKDGDTSTIDFEGFVDGVAFEGGKGEDHTLVLGSHQFIEGFEAQIVGHNVGEEFDVNVTFPEEYHAEELKGKPAVFKVKLKELKEKELPELDDEFAKDVSEFDTIAELKADLSAKLLEAKEKRAQDSFENSLVDVVVENLKGEIPQVMYDHKIDDMVRDFEYRLSSQGLNIELYLQYTGMDMENFRKTFAAQAERQVKIRLGLEKIAAVENLAVSDEDLDAEYVKLAEMYQMEKEEIKKAIVEKDLTADILCNKAIDLIRSTAVVTEVEEGSEKASEGAIEE